MALSSFNSDKNRIIRVRLSYSWPVEPAKIKSMGDYNISLLLHRTWFNYDESREVKPGVIDKWVFDKGKYTFFISKNAFWSDGSKILAIDLVHSLNRILKENSTYVDALKSIISIDSITLLSENTFSIETLDGEPSNSFFQRIGSQFFALVSADPTQDNYYSLNRYSGPFKLKEIVGEELIFVPNNYFDHNKSVQIANEIRVRPAKSEVSIQEFIENKTWENIIQTTTLIEPEILEVIKKSRMPIWTREHDKVSVLKPIASNKTDLKLLKNTLSFLQINYHKNLNQIPLPPNVGVAKSLQPLGYPLYYDCIDLPPVEEERKNKVKILAPNRFSARFHKDILSKCFEELGIEIKWDFLDGEDYMSKLFKEDNYDFHYFSFGVADPEVNTWIGLIFKNKFIEYNEVHESVFKRFSGIKIKLLEIQGYMGLLKAIQKEGGYMPLLHFSTLAIGQGCMDFSDIKKFDETIDYSKVKFIC